MDYLTFIKGILVPGGLFAWGIYSLAAKSITWYPRYSIYPRHADGVPAELLASALIAIGVLLHFRECADWYGATPRALRTILTLCTIVAAMTGIAGCVLWAATPH